MLRCWWLFFCSHGSHHQRCFRPGWPGSCGVFGQEWLSAAHSAFWPRFDFRLFFKTYPEYHVVFINQVRRPLFGYWKFFFLFFLFSFFGKWAFLFVLNKCVLNFKYIHMCKNQHMLVGYSESLFLYIFDYLTCFSYFSWKWFLFLLDSSVYIRWGKYKKLVITLSNQSLGLSALV